MQQPSTNVERVQEEPNVSLQMLDRPAPHNYNLHGRISKLSDRVVLDIVIHAPGAPCCPTLKEVFRLRYANGQLAE